MKTYVILSIMLNLVLIYVVIRSYFNTMMIRSEFIQFSDWSYQKIHDMADCAKWEITELIASSQGQKNDDVQYQENLGAVSNVILNSEKEWYEIKENFQMKLERNGIRRLDEDDKYYFIDAEVFSSNPFKQFFAKKYF